MGLRLEAGQLQSLHSASAAEARKCGLPTPGPRPELRVLDILGKIGSLQEEVIDAKLASEALLDRPCGTSSRPWRQIGSRPISAPKSSAPASDCSRSRWKPSPTICALLVVGLRLGCRVRRTLGQVPSEHQAENRRNGIRHALDRFQVSLCRPCQRTVSHGGRGYRRADQHGEVAGVQRRTRRST